MCSCLCKYLSASFFIFTVFMYKQSARVCVCAEMRPFSRYARAYIKYMLRWYSFCTISPKHLLYQNWYMNVVFTLTWKLISSFIHVGPANDLFWLQNFAHFISHGSISHMKQRYYIFSVRLTRKWEKEKMMYTIHSIHFNLRFFSPISHVFVSLFCCRQFTSSK